MPDSTGFGDYTETGQVIPVRLNGEEGGYTHAMYLDDEAPIAGGRELWGFPKKLASPKIEVESDVLVGSLHYGSVLCACATMGYKHRSVDHDTVLKALKAPNFILKIIPHVDGSPRICELVRFHLEDITLKEAWTGPAALGLFPHALCRRRAAAGARGRLGAAFQGRSDARARERWRSITWRSDETLEHSLRADASRLRGALGSRPDEPAHIGEKQLQDRGIVRLMVRDDQVKRGYFSLHRTGSYGLRQKALGIGRQQHHCAQRCDH